MLYIVRHGQTWWNWQRIIQGQSDSELSPKGIEQGKRIAKLLKDNINNISQYHFITSPIKRAVDYADIIATELSLDKEYIKEPLAQEISMGDLEGFPKIAVPKLFPEAWKEKERDPLHFTFPNGESRYHLKERAQQFLDKYDDLNNTILITHNGFSIALRMLLEKQEDGYLVDKKNSHFQNTVYTWDGEKIGQLSFPKFKHNSKFDLNLPVNWKDLEI